MSSIGETLRRERLRKGLDLEQISHELKISSRFLDAIETERFDRLPAGVFAKSFVRQYARLLGLDEEEMAGEVQRVIEPAPETDASKPDVPPIAEIHVPRVEEWDAVGDHRRFQWSSILPALALVVVVMLVCSGVYAFWQRARQQAALQPPPVEAPQQQAQTPPPTPTPAAPATQEQAPAAGQEAPPAAATPAPQQQAAAEPAKAEPTPNPAQPAPNPNTQVHVQVTAEEPVWVLARADGKYLFSGTLDANQSKSVEAQERLTLRLGNAGGVAITLNGKPIGPVGPKGQVREVQFTSGGFQIVAAPKPSLPEDKPI